jgi:hypothetical protein
MNSQQQTIFIFSGVTFLLATLLTFAAMTLYTRTHVDSPSTGVIVATSSQEFLHDETSVRITAENAVDEGSILPIDAVLFEYIAVTDSCGVHFEGECLAVRSGPGTDYPVISRLRNGQVLKIDGEVERDGSTWYKIVFDEWLRYPDRVAEDWYVISDYVEILLDEGIKTTEVHGVATTTKRILVDRSDQKLYAFDGDELFMEESISTGLELTPTPRGTFTVFKKTPSRYMQGPLPGLAKQDYYDLPGVPWNLYFTEQGAVIHGAYWHDSFGSRYSHGCVNLEPSKARSLYLWAPLGTPVIVRD